MTKLPVNYNELTQSERRQIRQEYCRLQDWKCLHCGNHLMKGPAREVQRQHINMSIFPQGFLKHPIHLHHNHTTGLTIGAVHSRCNAVLWQYHGE